MWHLVVNGDWEAQFAADTPMVEAESNVLIVLVDNINDVAGPSAAGRQDRLMAPGFLAWQREDHVGGAKFLDGTG